MAEDDDIIIKIRNDETYYCYHWKMKFQCLCNYCLRYLTKESPKFTPESILSENLYLKLCDFADETMFVQLRSGIRPYKYQSQYSLDDCILKISVRNNKKNICCYINEYRNIILQKESMYSSQYSVNLKFINFSLINDCSEFFPEGVLTLTIEIFLPVNVQIPTYIGSTTNIEKALKNLQLDEELSDVTLVVEKREFRAHKTILAAQSSVFRAMFKHDVKETAENRVVIEDISEQAMQQVLNYIYSGTVENENFGELLATEVLLAAHKYNLQDLIRICETALIKLLNTENVLKILAMTEVYKLDLLKNSALNFIAQNIKEVMETDEFKKFVDSSNLGLIKEIILASINN